MPGEPGTAKTIVFNARWTNPHPHVFQLFVLMDSSELSQELRFYLQLYFELIMESPVQRGDKTVPYEDVVAQLEADTVGSTTRIGLESASRFTCGPFSHTACLMLQVKKMDRLQYFLITV
jgi:Predicted Zn-dependent peptidases, insulinase-like